MKKSTTTIDEDMQQTATIVDTAMALLNLRNGLEGEVVDKDSSETLALQADTDKTLRLIDGAYSHIRDTIQTLGSRSPRLLELKKRLQLDQWQIAVFLLALLPYHNLHYRQVYAQFQSGREFPALSFLLKLLCLNTVEYYQVLHRCLKSCPLFLWRFIVLPDHDTDLLGGSVCIPTDVLRYLLDSHPGDTDSNHCLEKIPYPKHPLIPHPAVQEYKNKNKPRINRLIRLCGKPKSGRKSQALWLSGQAELFQLNTEFFQKYDDKPSCLKDCLRFIFLTDGNLYLPSGLQAVTTNSVCGELLTEWLTFFDFPTAGKIFFAEDEQHTPQWTSSIQRLAPQTIPISALTSDAQAKLWAQLAGHFFTSTLDDTVEKTNSVANTGETTLPDWQALSQAYPFSPGEIVCILMQAQQLCAETEAANGCPPMPSLETLLTLCEAACENSLAELASKCQCQDTLNDMVLSDTSREQLQEVVLHSRYARRLQTMGLRRSCGVQVLFWGSPGTGKTMAAGVVAHMLQRPLYKADLSTITSKWIGETEKHLAKLFDEAEKNHGVLFFDEADAVFGKRSTIESSHDKNANLGVSYLLQRMENFNGTLILATNFKSNIDAAFLRRVQLSVEFPKPQIAERLLLWQKALSQAWPATVDLKLPVLAELFELSGSNIRNIVVHATVLALDAHKQELIPAYVEAGILREYQKTDNSYYAQKQIEQWQASL